MKILKNIILVFGLLAMNSCGLVELDLLDNPNAVTPENAQADLFFNAIQLDLADFHSTVNNTTSRVVRHLAMTGGNVYENAFTGNSFNFAWNTAYAGLLPDLDALIALAGTEKPHTAGAAKVIKAHVLMTLVDMFGDVPMSEAGQGVSNLSPKADNQEDVYNAALALLDEAIQNLQSDDIGISGDLFYGGSADKWVKLANTLKIKWYLNVGSGDNSRGADIAAAAQNAITSPEDNFFFQYGTTRNTPESRHPWYVDGYEMGASIYQSNWFMHILQFDKSVPDPRIRYYLYRQDLSPVEEIDAFTLPCTEETPPLHYGVDQPYCTAGNGYWGRDHGNDAGIPPDTDRRTVAGIYPCGGSFDTDQSAAVANNGTDGALGAGIAPIMMSSFTHFMLAESALTRGMPGSPVGHLETAVRQSISTVMAFGAGQAGDSEFVPSEDDVNAYVQEVIDRFNAAPDQDAKLDVIMKEYHIALWGNSLEAYNGYRRTTFPSGMQPTLEPNSGEFPRLMYYPNDYLNLNANAGGQRTISEQVFWDKNPAGAIN